MPIFRAAAGSPIPALPQLVPQTSEEMKLSPWMTEQPPDHSKASLLTLTSLAAHSKAHYSAQKQEGAAWLRVVIPQQSHTSAGWPGMGMACAFLLSMAWLRLVLSLFAFPHHVPPFCMASCCGHLGNGLVLPSIFVVTGPLALSQVMPAAS